MVFVDRGSIGVAPARVVRTVGELLGHGASWWDQFIGAGASVLNPCKPALRSARLKSAPCATHVFDFHLRIEVVFAKSNPKARLSAVRVMGSRAKLDFDEWKPVVG